MTEVPPPGSRRRFPVALVVSLVVCLLLLAGIGMVAYALTGFSLARESFQSEAEDAVRGVIEPGESIIPPDQAPRILPGPLDPHHDNAFTMTVFTRMPRPGQKDRIRMYRVDVHRGLLMMSNGGIRDTTDVSDDPFFRK